MFIETEYTWVFKYPQRQIGTLHPYYQIVNVVVPCQAPDQVIYHSNNRCV